MLEVRIDPKHCVSSVEMHGSQLVQLNTISDDCFKTLNDLFGEKNWYFEIRHDASHAYHWILIHDESEPSKLKSLEFNNQFGYKVN